MRVSRAERLADNALSQTVTKDVLLGNLNYYPEILPYLPEGEQPHYVALLSVNADLRVDIGPQTGVLKSNNAALVASEECVRIAFNSNYVVEPYEVLEGIEVAGKHPKRSFRLHCGADGQSWSHTEAKTADDWIFEDTIAFIRDMIEMSSSIGDANISELKELERLHQDGQLTNAEYIQRKKDLVGRD